MAKQKLILVDSFGNEVEFYYNAFFPGHSNKMVAKARRFIESQRKK